MRRALVAGAAAVAALAAAAPPAGAYAVASQLCTMTDPRVTESSGVASSSVSDQWFWTHNDSGDSPRFFAFDRTCAVPAEYDLPGAAASDWEDMARGPDARGVMSLWFGDHGDNNSVRTGVSVYRVDEPTSLTPGVSTLPWQRFDFTYEDGPHDCETLLVDPRDGRLYVVTKSFNGASALYAAPQALSSTSSNVLRKADTLTFTDLYTQGQQPTEPPGAAPLGGASFANTGGDISPSGDRVVVRTYSDAYEWAIAPGETLAAAMAPGQPVKRLMLPPQTQGEGIAYSRHGGTLVLTSEYPPGGNPANAPVWLRSPDAGPEPVESVTPMPAIPEGRWPALAGLAALLGGATALVRRRRG